MSLVGYGYTDSDYPEWYISFKLCVVMHKLSLDHPGNALLHDYWKDISNKKRDYEKASNLY